MKALLICFLVSISCLQGCDRVDYNDPKQVAEYAAKAYVARDFDDFMECIAPSSRSHPFHLLETVKETREFAPPLVEPQTFVLREYDGEECFVYVEEWDHEHFNPIKMVKEDGRWWVY